MSDKTISVNEARGNGIRYLRRARDDWTGCDYLELPTNNGVWCTLHSPTFKMVSQQPGREDVADMAEQKLALFDFDCDEKIWVEHCVESKEATP